jgi:manganese transport protein
MRLPRIGPGAMVATAFVGPSTVAMCVRAGVEFGYALLWALALSALGAIVIQEMAARLGLVADVSLGDAIRRRCERHPVLYWIAIVLIVGGVGVGTAARQTGYLLGAAGGLRVVGGGSAALWGIAIAAAASGLLWFGSYRVIERVFVAMLALMAALFLAVGAVAAHHPGALIGGLLLPHLPDRSGLAAFALVGAAVVPYNLFLHASTARERWRGPADLPEARADLTAAIALGGLVLVAIVVIGAAQPGFDTADAPEIAARLQPVLGRWASVCFGLGLFAAGLTSAIAAPLAAAYAVSGIFGWIDDLHSPLLRLVWTAVMTVGLGGTLAGTLPLPALLFAQAVNGLLLPVLAVFLLIVMNDQRLLKGAANGWLANVLGGAMVILTILLGVVAWWEVF